MSTNKYISTIVSLVILFISTASAAADWKDNAKATAIAGGQNHSLIITQDKFAFGCGSNNDYQLGIGNDSTSQTTPVHVHGYNNDANGLPDVNDVSAGWRHSLILDANSSIWSIGYNYYGELGDSYTQQRKTPVLVHGISGGYLKHIAGISASRFGDSSTGQHSLAVDSNGLCYAWGLNHKGQLGQGSSDYNPHSTPLQVKSGEMDGGTYLHDIIVVSAGEDQSMALDINGYVWTWGQNSYDHDGSGYGRLGAGNTTADYNDLPVKVHAGQQNPANPNSALSDIVAISAGWNHCAALEDINPSDSNCQGRVYTWGYNGITGNSYSRSGGRLGDGTTTDRSTPVFVKKGEQAQDPNHADEPLDMIVAVAAGEGHSMALCADGCVYTWGDNYYGQLGNGKRGLGEKSLKPVKVKGWNGSGYLENIVAIAAGGWHSLALDADGTIYAWGRGEYGQTAIGLKNGYSGYNVSTPQIVHPVYNLNKQKFYFAIQTAVNDANNGNVIEASKGIYYENVNLDGKPLTLRSADPNNPNIVAETIFNAPLISSAVDYAVKSTNNTGSKVSGFTIANPDNENSYGIMCTKSTLEVSRCTIKDMTMYSLCCETGSYLQVSDCNIHGGGFVDNGLNCPDSNCSVDVDNCIFRNFKRGGIAAIFCCSDLNVTNCEITDNNTGISCGFKSNTAVNIANCLISGHTEKGIWFSCGDMSVYPSVSVHNNVIIANNRGIAFGYAYDIGDQEPADWFYGSIDASITNNLISGNTDGIFISPKDPVAMTFSLRNNTLADNGDGLHLIFSDGVGAPPYPTANIKNCILWGNLEYMINKENVSCNPGSNCFGVSVTYSDVQDAINGAGNIYYNPEFVKGDDYYHLDPNSRCIDAGDGNYPGETDIDGEPRMLDGDANGTVIVDMGADEFSATYNCGRADFNHDRIVNFLDYAVLANAWLTQSGGAGYNEICDLVEDNSIDNKDLKVFCMDCWLWQLPIGNILSESMMAQGGGGEESIFVESMEAQPEQMLAEQAEPVNVEELTNWLDEIWNTGDLQGIMTESEYLELKGAIEASGE